MLGNTRRYARVAAVATLAALPLALSGVAASATTLAPTTTVLTAKVSTSVTGQLVRFKITVKETVGTTLPTGTVQLADLGTPVGSPAPLVDTLGIMTAIVKVGFPAGSHTLTATYSGDTANAGSSSAGLPLTVSKAATTVVVTAQHLTKPGSYKLDAKIKVTKPGLGVPVPSGTVTFTIGANPPLPPVTLDSLGHAHVYVKGLTVGLSYTVTVTYAGDSNFSAPAAGTLTFIAS